MYSHIVLSEICVAHKKRFHNRETIPLIRISPLAESFSTLSWLAKILESIILSCIEGGGEYCGICFSNIKYLLAHTLYSLTLNVTYPSNKTMSNILWHHLILLQLLEEYSLMEVKDVRQVTKDQLLNK